jgi:hypothetical protein
MKLKMKLNMKDIMMMMKYGIDECINMIMNKIFDNLYSSGSRLKILEFIGKTTIDKIIFTIMSRISVLEEDMVILI